MHASSTRPATSLDDGRPRGMLLTPSLPRAFTFLTLLPPTPQ